MNFGFRYTNYNDISYMMYALQDGTITLNKGTQSFKISMGSNEHYEFFGKEDPIIGNHRKRILLTHNKWGDTTDEKYDIIILTTTGEPIYYSDEEILEFLNKGNVILSGAILDIEHPNLIVDLTFHLVYFYYQLGFNYLNYYKFDKKDNLLGLYHKPHVSGNSRLKREMMYKISSNILEDDLMVYPSTDYPIRPIIEPYTYLGHWSKNHITSYTDYVTSVCNIIFETCDNSIDNRGVFFTEKTLKAILFGQADIFFIWYGNERLFWHLHNEGYWFLNSEFYVENSIDAMDNSLFDTVIYLKNLKKELGDNKLVHEFLLSKYSDRLKNNIAIFNDTLLGKKPNRKNILHLLRSI